MAKNQVNSPKKTPQTTFHKVRQEIFLQHFFLFNKKYSFVHIRVSNFPGIFESREIETFKSRYREFPGISGIFTKG